MRVAALQLDVRSGRVGDNLAAVEEGLRTAAADGVALVVLPEMWPTSFLAANEIEAAALDGSRRAVERVRELTRELELVVCGSGYGGPDGAGLPTNRLHILDRGETAAVYDKVHLFSPTAEHEGFRAGERAPPTVDTTAGRVAGIVCYDLRFPELTRVPFRAQAELLLVPAQWPSTRASHWRALCIGRAVENQCFVVAANRTGSDVIGRRRMRLDFPGNSIVVNPAGEVLAEGVGVPGLVVAEVDLSDARSLQRRVPVRKDQRPDLYRRW